MHRINWESTTSSNVGLGKPAFSITGKSMCRQHEKIVVGNAARGGTQQPGE